VILEGLRGDEALDGFADGTLVGLELVRYVPLARVPSEVLL